MQTYPEPQPQSQALSSNPDPNRDLNPTPPQTLTTCIQLLTTLLQQHQVDHTHGIEHVMVVYEHGCKAVEAWERQKGKDRKMGVLDLAERENVLLACLLHDADDKKYFNSKDYQNAREILTKLNLPQNRVQAIIKMISLVSYSKNGDKISQDLPQHFYYPRYCDRLDAIGYKGLLRCYEYGLVCKNPVSLPGTTPIPTSIPHLRQIIKGRDELYRQNGGKSVSVIDHVYDKLLHVALPECIGNQYIRGEYGKREQEIVEFVMRHAGDGFVEVEGEFMRALGKEVKVKE